VVSKAGLDAVKNRKIHSAAGNQTPDRPARSLFAVLTMLFRSLIALSSITIILVIVTILRPHAALCSCIPLMNTMNVLHKRDKNIFVCFFLKIQYM
jgi:hypothetical protein